MELVEEKLLTVEEYFDFEKKSEIRHEFYYGELIPMPGESTIANLLAGNLYIVFRQLFKKKPFLVFEHDIKLMAKERKIYRYPDLVVINKTGDHKKFVTEPVLIVEVLSESTEDTDREKKKLEYFANPSLQYYLLVHQDETLVEMYSRVNEKNWNYEYYTSLTEKITLPFFETILKMEEIYEGIELN